MKRQQVNVAVLQTLNRKLYDMTGQFLVCVYTYSGPIVVSSDGFSYVTRLDGTAGWLYCGRATLKQQKTRGPIHKSSLRLDLWRSYSPKDILRKFVSFLLDNFSWKNCLNGICENKDLKGQDQQVLFIWSSIGRACCNTTQDLWMYIYHNSNIFKGLFTFMYQGTGSRLN